MLCDLGKEKPLSGVRIPTCSFYPAISFVIKGALPDPFCPGRGDYRGAMGWPEPLCSCRPLDVAVTPLSPQDWKVSKTPGVIRAAQGIPDAQPS